MLTMMPIGMDMHGTAMDGMVTGGMIMAGMATLIEAAGMIMVIFEGTVIAMAISDGDMEIEDTQEAGNREDVCSALEEDLTGEDHMEGDTEENNS
jgi:hypothetical protein